MDDRNILYDETDPKSIERYAKQLIGKTFKDIICNEELNDEEFISFASFARKGGLGNLVEKHFFNMISIVTLKQILKRLGLS